VIVAFLAMFVVRVIVVVRGLGRVGVGVVFEGVGRAQRFAFRARRGEPNKLPGPVCRSPGRLDSLRGQSAH